MPQLLRNPAFISDLLRNLQVHPIETHFSSCLPGWREIDYIPDYNKLYFICDGEGWLRIGDEEFYPVPGQICLLPARVKQSFSTISERTYRKYWCHFTASIGDLELFQWLETPFCMDVKDQPRMLSLFQELVRLHRDDSMTARIREKAVMLEVIACFLEEADAHVRFVADREPDADRLNRIERFIDERIADPITLEHIAKHVHLHPNYLVRYFNKHFGVSPLKYLNRKRMQKAKTILATTALPVKEVAELVGYPDTNHFAKAFRKESSCSPTEYRLQTRHLS
ncbi:AraC family transcriptional regulator [Cohnella soli]|uniref:AraC family transcriptional regulator n=1 Tax=Cohnella soli TaxID=425005 RepID=A0ABW0HNT5_9BACL